MPQRWGAQPLAHDGREGDELGFDRGEQGVVGQEEAVYDGLIEPGDQRRVGAERGEDWIEVVLIDRLHEGGAALGGLGR